MRSATKGQQIDPPPRGLRSFRWFIVDLACGLLRQLEGEELIAPLVLFGSHTHMCLPHCDADMPKRLFACLAHALERGQQEWPIQGGRSSGQPIVSHDPSLLDIDPIGQRVASTPFVVGQLPHVAQQTYRRLALSVVDFHRKSDAVPFEWLEVTFAQQKCRLGSALEDEIALRVVLGAVVAESLEGERVGRGGILAAMSAVFGKETAGGSFVASAIVG